MSSLGHGVDVAKVQTLQNRKVMSSDSSDDEHRLDERALGEWIKEQLTTEIVVETSGWAFDLVHRVAQRLNDARGEREALEPVVLWIPQVTAFICPGRYLYISRELLQRILYEDAVAMVIAHEMAHHDLGHLEFFSSTFSVLKHLPGAGRVGMSILAIRHMLVNPDRERQADEYGLNLCLAAGYDGYRCLELFDVLEAHLIDRRDLIGVFGLEELEELSDDPPENPKLWLTQFRNWIGQRTRSHPDLDTRRRELLARLSNFASKPSSNHLVMQNITTRATNNLKVSFYLAGGIAVLLGAVLFRPFAIVNAGQRGVVMHFGKVQDTVFDEGIHPIMPIVTSVKRLSVRVQKNTFNVDAASKDLQKVTTELTINWHIDPVKVNKVFQQIGDEEQIANGIITPAISEVLKAATANKTAEEIITKRTALKEEIDNKLKTRLAAYGVLVNDVSLVDFAFSPEFSRAIEAKQIAEQEAKQAEFIALKASKEAIADVNRAKGQAEAQRLQRLTLTPELLQKQAIEKWDGRFPTVMGGNGALPLINIDTSSLTNQQQRAK